MNPSETATWSASASSEGTSRLQPWQAFGVHIARVERECPDVLTYDLHFDDPRVADSFDYLPGQFNMLYVPGVGEAAISIMGRSRDGKGLRHSIRTVGNVTGAMAEAGIGMHLGLRGPFGSHWPIEQFAASLPATPKRDVLIVAGGIGIAPLHSMVDFVIAHREQVGQVSILLGARSPSDLLYRDQWEGWGTHDLEVQATVDRADRAWTGHVGVITLLVERIPVPHPDNTLVMTCGPEVMMRYVAGAAMEKGIPSRNIWVTLERNMNCAIGLCGHCQLGPEFICKDGPVLPYDRVRPWLRVQEL